MGEVVTGQSISGGGAHLPGAGRRCLPTQEQTPPGSHGHQGQHKNMPGIEISCNYDTFMCDSELVSCQPALNVPPLLPWRGRVRSGAALLSQPGERRYRPAY